VCQAGQVHKIRKTNFVDMHPIAYDFKNSWKFLKKYRWSRYQQKTLTSLTCLDIFMQNGMEGNGDVFSQENIIIALVA
jgi:hypothetical protein